MSSDNRRLSDDRKISSGIPPRVHGNFNRQGSVKRRDLEEIIEEEDTVVS